jgi:hypothetical protein
MAYHTLIKQNVSNLGGEVLDVHLRQTGGWEEAARVDELGRLYPIECADQSGLARWLNEKGDARLRDDVGRAERRRLNHAAHFAKALDVELPALEKGDLSNLDLFGQSLHDHIFKLVLDAICHLDPPTSQLLDGLDLEDVETGVTSAVELVIDLEDPSVDV